MKNDQFNGIVKTMEKKYQKEMINFKDCNTLRVTVYILDMKGLTIKNNKYDEKRKLMQIISELFINTNLWLTVRQMIRDMQMIKHNLSNYLQTDIELNVCSESIKVDLKKTKSVAQMFPPLKPAVPHTKY